MVLILSYLSFFLSIYHSIYCLTKVLSVCLFIYHIDLHVSAVLLMYIEFHSNQVYNNYLLPNLNLWSSVKKILRYNLEITLLSTWSHSSCAAKTLAVHFVSLP